MKLAQIRNNVDFLLKTGLCTLWNIGSRAETLPGIKLSDNMIVRNRETVWDVENYNFRDEGVEKLYHIITRIKKIYILPRAEDYLFRVLRDSIKIRSFHEKVFGMSKTDEMLAADTYRIQHVTYKFINEALTKIEEGENVSDYHRRYVTKQYVNEMMGYLKTLKTKYVFLLNEKDNEIDIDKADKETGQLMQLIVSSNKSTYSEL